MNFYIWKTSTGPVSNSLKPGARSVYIIATCRAPVWWCPIGPGIGTNIEYQYGTKNIRFESDGVKHCYGQLKTLPY